MAHPVRRRAFQKCGTCEASALRKERKGWYTKSITVRACVYVRYEERRSLQWLIELRLRFSALRFLTSKLNEFQTAPVFDTQLGGNCTRVNRVILSAISGTFV